MSQIRLKQMNRYEPIGSRTGVLENTKDGYEMIKVGLLTLKSHTLAMCKYIVLIPFSLIGLP